VPKNVNARSSLREYVDYIGAEGAISVENVVGRLNLVITRRREAPARDAGASRSLKLVPKRLERPFPNAKSERFHAKESNDELAF